MWKITATWKNTNGSTVKWDETEWPDFTSFLMAISHNPSETYNDLLFIGSRISNVETLTDPEDESVAWITKFNVPTEQVKNEVVEYYTNTVAPKYSHLGIVTITSEQV
jgi:hypothetical protein